MDSLYIPGAKPDAISADVLGTDDSGHTTWRLQPGVPSGTFTDADRAAFTGASNSFFDDIRPTEAYAVAFSLFSNDGRRSDGRTRRQRRPSSWPSPERLCSLRRPRGVHNHRIGRERGDNGLRDGDSAPVRGSSRRNSTPGWQFPDARRLSTH